MKDNKDMFHYTSCGLQNVWLVNGFVKEVTPFGEAVSIRNVKGLHALLGHQIITHKKRLAAGDIRFLRIEMDFSQKHLADVLGVGESTVRAWENSRTKIALPADRLLRALYMGSLNDEMKIAQLIADISELNRETHRQSLVLETADTTDWRIAA
jgi:putative transcriptional regulator